MLGLFLAAIGDVPQQTVNPNTGDAWLGRLYTTALLIGAIVALWQIAKRGFDRRLDLRIEAHADTVTAAFSAQLRAHTDQEGQAVKAAVNDAVGPVLSLQSTMAGQMTAFMSGLDTMQRRTDDRFRNVDERIGALASRRD